MQPIASSINIYWMFNIKKMLVEFATGKNSDEAVRNVLQISVARLEKEWRDTFTS